MLESLSSAVALALAVRVRRWTSRRLVQEQWTEEQDDALLWTEREDREAEDQREVRRPRARSWARFWDLLDEVGGWSWPQDCGALAMDGTSWSIDIVVGDRLFRSRGVNAWPEPGGVQGEETAEFRRVRQGLSKLVGKKPFR